MRVPVIRLSWTQPDEFVGSWSEFYEDPREEHYVNNIDMPLTPERVRNLYLWKSGGRLWKPQCRGLEQNVIGRLRELGKLDKDYPPLDFLLRFARGGMIWRIFLLHIWQSRKYPIYDQHTYRAMRFLQHLQVEEIPSNPRLIAQTYVNDYIPFFNRFPRMPDRRVDKALFAFGKFLKTPLGQRIATADGRQGS